MLTSRLRLRQWTAADLDPLAALNADPEVMRHFPTPLSRAESQTMLERLHAHIAEHGWGLWALELRDTGQFIGFTGLATPRFEAHFTPAVEVGWRLSPGFWGHGYATEAAQAAVAYGFSELGLDEIVSFTTMDNRPSRAVMERLGMTYESVDDFDHPSLPQNHPLCRHVLYRLRSTSTPGAPLLRRIDA